VHAIGASEAAASFELETVINEGPEITQEVEAQPVGQKEPKEEVECPSHETASFVKGKPRSILSLPLYFQSIIEYVISLDALRIGVVMEPLIHYTLPCLDILSLPGCRVRIE